MPKRRSGSAARRPRRRRARRPWWLLGVVVAAAAVVGVARLAHVPLPHPRPVRPTGAATVDVFFVRYAGPGGEGTLVPVRRSAGRGTATERVEAAVRALLAGPSSDERRRGVVSEVPAGTGLRGVRLGGGVATVDLTSSYAAGGGSASMLARVWQVVYTATGVPDVHAVQILINGRQVPALGGEGLMVDRPIERPASTPSF